ncbi:hypothetical protein IBTHAUMO2_1070025 [Nitrosopumilaceae archaeon]|nr:hypothetical protein IBTHAUMO2_1070025 [Nitrosopumilaceae archaeon]
MRLITTRMHAAHDMDDGMHSGIDVHYGTLPRIRDQCMDRIRHGHMSGIGTCLTSHGTAGRGPGIPAARC